MARVSLGVICGRGARSCPIYIPLQPILRSNKYRHRASLEGNKCHACELPNQKLVKLLADRSELCNEVATNMMKEVATAKGAK